MEKKKYMFGTGLGGFGTPNQGLGLETLGMWFAALQKARENNQKSVLWHFGTEGYGVSLQDRRRIITDTTEIAEIMTDRISKMPILTSQGVRRAPHLVRVFPRI
jgi:hypothetical protein